MPLPQIRAAEHSPAKSWILTEKREMAATKGGSAKMHSIRSSVTTAPTREIEIASGRKRLAASPQLGTTTKIVQLFQILKSRLTSLSSAALTPHLNRLIRLRKFLT